MRELIRARVSYPLRVSYHPRAGYSMGGRLDWTARLQDKRYLSGVVLKARCPVKNRLWHGLPRLYGPHGTQGTACQDRAANPGFHGPLQLSLGRNWEGGMPPGTGFFLYEVPHHYSSRTKLAYDGLYTGMN